MFILDRSGNSRRKLVRQLSSATEATPKLMSDVVKTAGERLASLNSRSRIVQQLNNSIADGTSLDAALLFLSIERPGWSLRRLIHDDGMWYCSLSRTPNVPIAFDDTIESHHPDPALAIVLGVLAEREERLPAAAPDREQSTSSPIAVACCENFS